MWAMVVPLLLQLHPLLQTAGGVLVLLVLQVVLQGEAWWVEVCLLQLQVVLQGEARWVEVCLLQLQRVAPHKGRCQGAWHCWDPSRRAKTAGTLPCVQEDRVLWGPLLWAQLVLCWALLWALQLEDAQGLWALLDQVVQVFRALQKCCCQVLVGSPTPLLCACLHEP